MRVDYRSFLDKMWEALPAAEYVAMASDPHVLGDPLLKTQHFIGSSKWEYVSDTEAIGWHQLRVPHQRYTDESRKEIAMKGHAHGSNQHWYRKIDDVWKFAGLAPIIRWGEYDFDSMFASGREAFGDKEKVEEQVAVAAGLSVEVQEANAEAHSGNLSTDKQLQPVAPHSATIAAPPADRPVDATTLTETEPRSEETNPQTADLLDPQHYPLEQAHLPMAVEQIQQAALSGYTSGPDPAEPMRMAEEDGKQFDVKVDQVPVGGVSITS